MGYSTRFTGRVTVEPPLTGREAAELLAFSETRHERDRPGHGFYCQWLPTEDRTGLEWDGEEKFYDGDLWMAVLIDRFLQPGGHVVNGVIDAEGEDPDDFWRLEVRDNVVYVVRMVDYPGYDEIDPADPGAWGPGQWSRYEAAARRDHVSVIRGGQAHDVGPAAAHGFDPVAPG
jgi:hypothetical protein